MLQAQIEALFDQPSSRFTEKDRRLFRKFKEALNDGEIRAAQPDASAPSGWRVNSWVKKGILLGFRMGAIVDMSVDASRQPFFDKSTYPVKKFTDVYKRQEANGDISPSSSPCIQKFQDEAQRRSSRPAAH